MTTTETGTVEKVARAIYDECRILNLEESGGDICQPYTTLDEKQRQQMCQVARAAIAAMPDSTQLLQTMAGALERIAQPVYVAEPARKADSAWRVALGERIEIARAVLAQFRAQEQRS